MIWLFIVLMVILGFLWFLDELLTQLDVKKYGLKAEENPVMKHFLKEGNNSAFKFKLLSFVAFGILAWFIYSQDNKFFYGLIILMIILYLAVAIRNFEILEEKD